MEKLYAQPVPAHGIVSGLVVSNDAFCMETLSAQVPLAERQKAKAQTAEIKSRTSHPNFSPAAGCTISVPTWTVALVVARSFPNQAVRGSHILGGLLEILKDRCCKRHQTCGFQWKKFLTLFVCQIRDPWTRTSTWYFAHLVWLGVAKESSTLKGMAPQYEVSYHVHSCQRQ
jgi:hypothetical protein